MANGQEPSSDGNGRASSNTELRHSLSHSIHSELGPDSRRPGGNSQLLGHVHHLFLNPQLPHMPEALLLRSHLMASSCLVEIKEDPLPLSQLHRVKEDAMPLNPPRFQIRFIPTRLKMCSSVLFVWKDFEMRMYVHTVQNYAVTNAFEGG